MRTIEIEDKTHTNLQWLAGLKSFDLTLRILLREHAEMQEYIRKNIEETEGDRVIKMKKIKVDIFKPSGKWYTNEFIAIPKEIQDFNISEYIKDNARIRNKTYLFHGVEYEVPHLVHVGD